MAEYGACILEIRMAVDINIKELLVIGDSDFLIHQVQDEWTTKNVKILSYLHYVKELCKKFTKIEFKHVPRIQNVFAGALATLSSMIHHPDKNYIDPIEIEVEASIYKALTKKVVADFVHNNKVYRFWILESIITDNVTTLTSDLTREICEKFKIIHRNSIVYRSQMNGAVEAANKNNKRFLRKIVDNHRQWHEKLSLALLGYRTTMRMSTGATSYMLVYGMEAVICAEVEILSLRVIQEAKLDYAELI
ncbi:uncharacterized protein [Nicotiana tomentosiformis]|uniref:uncharacterized protein n=1 Tax=Nicotiana tomentosiformis TaxID=4098 RepID=UPI00388CA252